MNTSTEVQETVVSNSEDKSSERIVLNRRKKVDDGGRENEAFEMETMESKKDVPKTKEEAEPKKRARRGVKKTAKGKF